MKKNSRTAIVVLAVLLLAAIVYIVVDKLQEFREQEKQELLRQGAIAGYQQAIKQLLQEVQTCRPVPVFINNASVEVIAVDCLAKP